MKRIRVLVVDDSALIRKMIPQILNADHEIEVVGTAMDGIFALKKIPELRPDVIPLDIDMPKMDGIETLRSITQHFAIPTIIVSSLSQHDADMTLKALGMGAFDFVTKPLDAISLHISDIGGDLVRRGDFGKLPFGGNLVDGFLVIRLHRQDGRGMNVAAIDHIPGGVVNVVEVIALHITEQVNDLILADQFGFVGFGRGGVEDGNAAEQGESFRGGGSGKGVVHAQFGENKPERARGGDL